MEDHQLHLCLLGVCCAVLCYDNGLRRIESLTPELLYSLVYTIASSERCLKASREEDEH